MAQLVAVTLTTRQLNSFIRAGDLNITITFNSINNHNMMLIDVAGSLIAVDLTDDEIKSMIEAWNKRNVGSNTIIET